MAPGAALTNSTSATATTLLRFGSGGRHLVDSFLHEVQKLLDCVHIFPTIFLLSSLHGKVDQHVQAGHGQVIQQVDSVAANEKNLSWIRIILKIPTADEY